MYTSNLNRIVDCGKNNIDLLTGGKSDLSAE